MVLDSLLGNAVSGADNRNINDDGSSQKLSIEDIESMKYQGLPAFTIMESLIENSKTFASKTEYSQVMRHFLLYLVINKGFG